MVTFKDSNKNEALFLDTHDFLHVRNVKGHHHTKQREKDK